MSDGRRPHAHTKLGNRLPSHSRRCNVPPRYNADDVFVLHFERWERRCLAPTRSSSRAIPTETEIGSFPVNGDQVSVTLRIPDTLRDAAKKEAALRGMSFSAFVRTCMIEELAKKGN